MKPSMMFKLSPAQKNKLAPLFVGLNQPNPKTHRFDGGMLSGTVLAEIEKDGAVRCLRLDHKEAKRITRYIRRVIGAREL